jgi:hypothetical protein
VRFKQVSILKRKVADAGSLKRARELHRDLFAKMPREDEDGLVAETRESLKGWQMELKGFEPLSATRFYPGQAMLTKALTRIARQLAISDSFEFVEALVQNRDEWLELADDIHDLSGFYNTQVATWRRMLEALDAFADNRDALTSDPEAAAALSLLEGIRANPTPWKQVSQIEPLVSGVENVNEALAQGQREKVIRVIDTKLAELIEELDAVEAEPDLRNTALRPMQTLKTTVAGLTSLPRIAYCEQQVGTALDAAMATIEKAVFARSMVKDDPSQRADPPVRKTPARTLKPTQVVRAASLSAKSYLESEDEVESYITRLRAELLAAIQAGKRARIQ